MRILVGSRNPVKINATEIAFSQYFKDIRVEGYDVDSQVSEMPVTEEETKKGAINRAIEVFTKDKIIRTQAFENSLIYSLVKFVNPKIYV